MGGCSGRLQNAGNRRARDQAEGRSEPDSNHNAGRNTHPPQRAPTTDPATTDPPNPRETASSGRSPSRNTHPPQRTPTTDPATTDPPNPRETPREAKNPSPKHGTR
ncbi:hypothetical protein GCM10018953_57690 [Streptosporangium nondiastaticum]